MNITLAGRSPWLLSRFHVNVVRDAFAKHPDWEDLFLFYSGVTISIRTESRQASRRPRCRGQSYPLRIRRSDFERYYPQEAKRHECAGSGPDPAPR